MADPDLGCTKCYCSGRINNHPGGVWGPRPCTKPKRRPRKSGAGLDELPPLGGVVCDGGAVGAGEETRPDPGVECRPLRLNVGHRGRYGPVHASRRV